MGMYAGSLHEWVGRAGAPGPMLTWQALVTRGPPGPKLNIQTLRFELFDASLLQLNPLSLRTQFQRAKEQTNAFLLFQNMTLIGSMSSVAIHANRGDRFF